MELKQEANTEPRKRFHLLRRLHKANKHALQLLKLCEECKRCDARTRLEAQVWIGATIIDQEHRCRYTLWNGLIDWECRCKFI